jgi:cell division control protein 6
MLSEIELSGLISGRMIHQGIHGNTKKFNLTVSPELVKNTLKSKETFTEIL